MHMGEDTPAGGPAAGRTLWGIESSVDPDGFNADLADGEPTVDIAIYYPDNLRPAHRRRVRLEAVLDGLARVLGVRCQVPVLDDRFCSHRRDGQITNLAQKHRETFSPASHH